MHRRGRGAGGIGRVISGVDVYDDQPVPAPATGTAQRRGEVRTAPEPGTGRKHVGQAESFERPLERRAAMIARPARVRIRRRKPWVLARRRLLGWNVRLLTRGLPDRRACGARHAYAHRLSVVSSPDGRRSTGPTRTARRGQAAATVARDDRVTVRAWPARGQTRAGRAPRPPVGGCATRHGGTAAETPARDTPEQPPPASRWTAPYAGKIFAGLWTTACWAHRPIVSVSPVVGSSRRVDPWSSGTDFSPADASRSREEATNRHTAGQPLHRLWTTVWTARSRARRCAPARALRAQTREG